MINEIIKHDNACYIFKKIKSIGIFFMHLILKHLILSYPILFFLTIDPTMAYFLNPHVNILLYDEKSVISPKVHHTPTIFFKIIHNF
jgi:hypothetical protein